MPHDIIRDIEKKLLHWKIVDTTAVVSQHTVTLISFNWCIHASLLKIDISLLAGLAFFCMTDFITVPATEARTRLNLMKFCKQTTCSTKSQHHRVDLCVSGPAELLHTACWLAATQYPHIDWFPAAAAGCHQSHLLSQPTRAPAAATVQWSQLRRSHQNWDDAVAGAETVSVPGQRVPTATAAAFDLANAVCVSAGLPRRYPDTVSGAE